MKFFIDTANIKEIEDFASKGMVDGVTTNPSLVLKSGQDIHSLIKGISQIISGPISVEVVATDHKGMIKEAEKVCEIASNVTVKLPITWDGIKTCKILSSQNISVNMTLCFSVTQAILVAKAGASFVSPFVGRFDDLGADGMSLIADIVQAYNNYTEFTTEVLVASVRSPLHVQQAALIGAGICTVPAKVLNQLIRHPLTDRGLDQFLEDWKKTGQKI